MKKKIIIIVSILVFIGVGIFAFILFTNSKTKISEERLVHDIRFYNAKISKKGDKYIFYVSLKAKKDVDVDNFDANIKSRNGKSITILKGYIGTMKKGDLANVEIETPVNLKKAYEITYTVNAK